MPPKDIAEPKKLLTWLLDEHIERLDWQINNSYTHATGTIERNKVRLKEAQTAKSWLNKIK